jgi:hypothetical protein
MFALPSMWNLVISTIVFFIVAWYLNRYCDKQDIPKGTARSLSVFMLAYLLSWGSGELVDWLQGPQPKSAATQDVSQLLKQLGATPP